MSIRDNILNLDPLTSTLIKIPVDKNEGDIFVDFTSVDNDIPAQITTSRNNEAIFKICNTNDHHESADMNKIITTPDFNIPNISEINAHFQQETTNQPITTNFKDLIRTVHLNEEEKYLILKLCKEYSDEK